MKLLKNASFAATLTALTILGLATSGLAKSTSGGGASSKTYSITDLGINTYTQINDPGQIIGTTITTSGSSNTIILSQGQITTIGSASNLYANSINNKGQVVGALNPTSGGSSHVFVWNKGTTTDLGTLGNNFALAKAINNSGQISGVLGSGDGNSTAFVCKINNCSGTLIKFSQPGGTVNSYDINDGGTVAGSATASNSSLHAYIWNKGTKTDLGTLGGSSSEALSLNNAGAAVGYSYVASGSYHAFIWQKGKMTDLGSINLPGIQNPQSKAFAINNRGPVVGSIGSVVPNASNRAFIWQKGKMVDLNSLIPANSGWTLQSATAINNSGKIVGTGLINGETHSFLLTPLDSADSNE